MKNKGMKIILSCILIIGLFIGFNIFTHSTAERVIRTNLFFKGHYIDAFRTEIFESPITDSQYGTLYSCKNPAIGPDHYDIDYIYKCFGMFKYWYINWAGTGGG